MSSNETILGLHNETKGLPLNRIAFYTLVQALHLVSFAGSRETKRPCLLGLFSIAKLVGRTKFIQNYSKILVFLKKNWKDWFLTFNSVCRACVRSVLGRKFMMADSFELT